ncbi:MAG: hypothetical protein NC392_06100 [Roseburia sp.]|nr:hypothetical protein [Roseburia sp.]MCM1201673.1 hypothetical protein [Bacteroides fragilis]
MLKILDGKILRTDMEIRKMYGDCQYIDIMNLRFMIAIRRSPNEQAHSSC